MAAFPVEAEAVAEQTAVEAAVEPFAVEACLRLEWRLTDFAELKKSASWPGVVAEMEAPRLVPCQDPEEHRAVRAEAPVAEVTCQGPDIG